MVGGQNSDEKDVIGGPQIEPVADVAERGEQREDDHDEQDGTDGPATDRPVMVQVIPPTIGAAHGIGIAGQRHLVEGLLVSAPEVFQPEPVVGLGDEPASTSTPGSCVSTANSGTS